MTDPQNPQAATPVPPAESSSTVTPPAATPPNPAPASSAVPDPAAAPSAPVTAAAGPSTPAPANPMASVASATSASAVLGKILGFTASVLVGIIPTIPVGVVTEAATIAEGGLRAIAEWLTTKGSDNALTEAQAEAALQNLLKNLATLTAPLATPASLENPPATS